MSVHLGVIMDPISKINIEKDSTFSMLLKAKKRNYILYYMQLGDVFLKKDRIYGKTKILNVINDKKKWFSFSEEKIIPLSKLDVILIRKDPPVNMEFIYLTYLLDKLKKENVLLINNPTSLRNYNEKLLATNFPEIIPQTLMSNNISEIKKFLSKHKDIIIKPLNAMGGKSIFRIKIEDQNKQVILETMTKNGSKFCLSQKYITDIKNGDKRILIIDNYIVPWCLTRLPIKGENRANLAVGGIGIVKTLNKTDYKIANTTLSFLKKKGLIFVGLDIIGNKLIEINVTSPTGICQIEKFCKISIAEKLFNFIEKKIIK
ncbi:glutathione synthase [Buchnera aphidicola (Mindarus keteleerifoliae)]|uniref:glutathione synthase n=1 Tax=Buchnera aphidicola TaxID=9 RepID=UPI0031B6ED85